MTFEREHGDLHVRLTQDRESRIVKADLILEIIEEHHLQLTPHQLYALVDDVAVADPEEWARRFDPRGPTELALRRVAGYFRERATENEAAADLAGPGRERFRGMEDAFALAVTRVMEEIEGLYPEQDTLTQEDRSEAIGHIQRYHTRRN